ncbi:hypothetical protein ACJ5ZS_21665 [Aeromonas salmonicida]|uniref:hypothetical protein n=1 Tax=Aeromonas salmonicida TaxID=645 RepID=UPI0038BA644D
MSGNFIFGVYMYASLLVTIVFAVILKKLYKFSNVALWGSGAHPIGLFYIIQIFIFSMPGVLMISFMGVQSIRYDGISGPKLLEIGGWYFYALMIMSFVLCVSFRIFNISSYNTAIRNINKFYVNNYWSGAVVLIWFCLICTLIQFFLFEKPSVYYLFKGDALVAYQSRVDMQTNPSKYYPPFIRTFLVFINIYQSYITLFIYKGLVNRSKKHGIYLLVSIVIAIYHSFYETQKAPFIMLIMGLIFIMQLYTKSTKNTIGYIAFLFVISILTTSVIMDLDINSAIEGVFDRVLLGQNQGFYHIINVISPNEKYLFQDFYFAESLGIKVARADIDVLPYIYGDRDDVVNVNSFFLGQAWSMFGLLGLIMSPFIVGIVIAMIIKIIDVLISYDRVIFVPFMIYMIPSLSVNQSFTQFLYGKYFIINFVYVILVFVLFKLCISLNKGN